MKLLPIALLAALPAFTSAADLDSLLADNRVRAGDRADLLFGPIDRPDSALFPNGLDDYRFLLANLPLSDLAEMDAATLEENCRLAHEAREKFSWGKRYSDELYRSFVLPHRMSQEPFVRYRDRFMNEIGPRVEKLSMADAILEVNHWCHEMATYRPTDGRDQDPLTTIRSGFGRCEEEMILCVAALRSVGIPARQCYTPYWAHSDDNHAWVEAWADGKWYYLGACEPAQNLNEAWFSGPAKRAMLVVSSAYGDYQGDEPVLRRYGRSTLISSTAVYGPVKELVARVVDDNGDPASGVRVIYSLWNYGTFMPATGMTTDKDGVAKLTCGIGDWFIGATTTTTSKWFGLAKEKTLAGFMRVKGDQREVTMKLTQDSPLGRETVYDYNPPAAAVEKPPEVISAEGIARGVTPAIIPPSIEGGNQRGVAEQGKEITPPTPPAIAGGEVLTKAERDSLFRLRLAWEDSVREHDVWNRWQTEASEFGQIDDGWPDTSGWGGDSTLAEFYRKARGNWGFLYAAGWGNLPWEGFRDPPPVPVEEDCIERRKDYDHYLETCFNSLSEKDLRDIGAYYTLRLSVAQATIGAIYNGVGLEEDNPPVPDTSSECEPPTSARLVADYIDPFLYISPRYGRDSASVSYPIRFKYALKLDSVAFDRYKSYILTPRIDYEPSIPWQGDLIDFLNGHRDLLGTPGDKAVIDWLRENIKAETSPDRLGAPLTPAQCLQLKRGTEGDLDRLYIGFCRVRGIPARRNPMTDQVERWEDGRGWVVVNMNEKGKLKNEKVGMSGKVVIEVAEGDSVAAEALFMKDWALAKWEGSLGSVQDLGWHQPFKAMTWPQELPTGTYLLSSGKRREDGSAPVKVVWFEVKPGEESRVKLEFR